MKNGTRLIVALAILLGAAFSLAQAKEASRIALLLEKVGYNAQLEGLQSAWNDNGQGDVMNQFTDPVEAEKFDNAWRESVAKAFGADKLKASMVARMEGTLSGPELDKLDAFYDSEFGKKITTLEIEAQKPDAEAQMMARASQIITVLEGDAERKRVFAEIDSGLQLKKSGTDMMINLMLGTQIGMAAASKNQPNMSFAEMREQLERQRPALGALVGGITTLSMAYTYESLSVVELETYRDFLLSTEGRKLYELITKHTNALLTESSFEMGRDLMLAMGRQPI